MDTRRNFTTFFYHAANNKNEKLICPKKSKKVINLPIHRIDESDYDVVIEDDINPPNNTPAIAPPKK